MEASPSGVAAVVSGLVAVMVEVLVRLRVMVWLPLTDRDCETMTDCETETATEDDELPDADAD